MVIWFALQIMKKHQPLMPPRSSVGLSVRHLAQLNGGRPNSRGSNSSMLLSRSVASQVTAGSMLLSGTITTCIPAASAALTPLGASSNTKHWARTEERKTKWFYPLSLLGVQDSSPTDVAQAASGKTNPGEQESAAAISILPWKTQCLLRVIAFSFVRRTILSIYYT